MPGQQHPIGIDSAMSFMAALEWAVAGSMTVAIALYCRWPVISAHFQTRKTHTQVKLIG